MDLGPSTQVENIKWYRIEPTILNNGFSLYELSIREVILITYFVLYINRSFLKRQIYVSGQH